MVNVKEIIPSCDELKTKVPTETDAEVKERRLKEHLTHYAAILHRNFELGFSYADLELDYDFHKLYGGEQLVKDLKELGYSAEILSYDISTGEKVPEEIVINFVEVHGEFYKDCSGYRTKEQVLADIRKNCEAMVKNHPERYKEITDELVEKIFNSYLGKCLTKVVL